MNYLDFGCLLAVLFIACSVSRIQVVCFWLLVDALLCNYGYLLCNLVVVYAYRS